MLSHMLRSCDVETIVERCWTFSGGKPSWHFIIVSTSLLFLSVALWVAPTFVNGLLLSHVSARTYKVTSKGGLCMQTYRYGFLNGTGL